jgi:hypothetical protein
VGGVIASSTKQHSSQGEHLHVVEPQFVMFFIRSDCCNSHLTTLMLRDGAALKWG